MASFKMDDYTSDNDQIHEEQIQYTYLDEEIAPMEEIMNEEIEEQNFGMINIEEYERVRDQAEELDGRNWELKMKCKIYELELRIMKRSISERIRDQIRYWKEISTNLSHRTTTWIKWMYRQATEDALIYPAPLRYRDMLEARYYPHDLHLE